MGVICPSSCVPWTLIQGPSLPTDVGKKGPFGDTSSLPVLSYRQQWGRRKREKSSNRVLLSRGERRQR